MKFKVAILKSEAAYEHELWIKVCEKTPHIECVDIIELTNDNWLAMVTKKDYDLFLLRPPGRSEQFKRLYDERVYIISSIMRKRIYPSYNEVLIFENKRLLRDWLISNTIPCPPTYVFFHEKEAISFINKSLEFPLVGKTNIGASGSGVVFMHNKEEAKRYINQAFSIGVKTITGPKLFKGSLLNKIIKSITKKGFLKNRMKEYSVTANLSQKGFVILQKFVPHSFEWRCVRIGDSYFAHKKMAVNNKSSGTLIKGYDPVNESLLDFIRSVTEKTNLTSVSIDLFEKGNEFLVNEIQCFFGQSDPYQMLVDGVPGRYRHLEGKWVFEPGDFNTHESYDLRIEHALNILKLEIT